MIRFNLIRNGVTVQAAIKFTHFRNEHTIVKSPLTGKRKAKEDTFSEAIVMIGDPLDLNYNEFIGRSYVHPDDHFVAESGRRNSLTRALEVAMMGKHINNRDERQFWVAYFSR